ncbi:cell envelope integrity EipB family protein [Sneathiella limimaris]|uniref:cell envelope integrity EipB family protein n=1 Tax=Sneathiella limimaris TaxID=1964213 RepID=UPI00146DC9C3|nr:cell envelope integrity EipB family protein [Sneathiella limimaris]
MTFKNRVHKFGLNLLVASCGLFVGQTALAASFESHRAVYDLKLAESYDGSGVENARGRIVLQFESTCEGSIVNQRTVVEIGNAGGGVVVSDYSLSTFEAKDGKSMQFSVSNSINGQTVEEFKGKAIMTGDGGKVTFSKGEIVEMDLPKDVLFPTAHSAEMLKAAIEGKKLLSAKVYDGNGTDGLQDSLTIIGKPQSVVSKIIEDNGMGDQTSWYVQMSFFDLSEQKSEPDYKVSYRMYENGVGTDLLMDYQEFAMKGELVQLEFLPMDSCN